MTTVTQARQNGYSKKKVAGRKKREAGMGTQKGEKMETTITYKDATQAAWEHEVYTQATKMREAFPALSDRLDSAIVLVRDGAVNIDEDGIAYVESRTEPGKRWRVDGGTCACPDAQFHAPHGRCAHRIALGLYRQVKAACEATLDWHPEPLLIGGEAGSAEQEARMRREAGMPASGFPLPAPGSTLPEAAFSVCLKGRRHGVDVLLTLRGQTRGEFLHHLQDALDVQAQLDQLCGLFDEGVSEPEAEPAPAQATPVCLYHGTLKPSTKVPGTWFCAHKLTDGTYCKERYPKA